MLARNYLSVSKPRHTVLAVGLVLVACTPEPTPTETVSSSGQSGDQATYVGGQQCAACHPAEAGLWENSHHDLAMQTADPDSVLGDFSDAQFNYNDVTSEFFTRDESYWVRTDGPNGELMEYEVTHTFGVEPLQQYLTRFPNGRYQALSIAWDSRPLEQGGQRWFHLYPGDTIDYADPLHWTGIFQNWNSSCAECHSTNLQKNFSLEGDLFETSFSSMDVDCEACHGAGSLHVQAPESFGLELPPNPDANWLFPQQARIAERVPALEDQREVEVCAQCHSRRSQFTDDHHPGDPLLNAFRPSLLDAGLYHADGQILDEVYVYGSFLQSKMHAAGVTCSDCHDPHSTELRFEGNALCGQCHLASEYFEPTHHHHAQESPGSACVNCHMPAEIYMAVDPRRDHSFRVPRPDLSVALGTPNACNGCHQTETPQWAAEIVAEWFPEGRSGTPHYGEAIHAARQWSAERGSQLLTLVNDPTAPAIVRATAVRLLTAQLDDAAFGAIADVLQLSEPLLHLVALEALESAPLETRIDLGQRFLTDPLRALRITAARSLLPARPELSERRRNDLDNALTEYWVAQQFNADREEGLFNTGTTLAQLGQFGEAETALQAVIDMAPHFTAAYINLADLYRQTGREDDVESLLRSAVETNPADPAGHFALGLSLVRSQRLTDALESLNEAASLAPDDPYYQYVIGIALNSTGERVASITSLRETHERFPGHRDTLFALATIHRDGGEFEQAVLYASRLLELSPTDAPARALLAELESTAAR